jgi:hypothetical protein
MPFVDTPLTWNLGREMGVNLHRMSGLSMSVRIRHVLLLVIPTGDLCFCEAARRQRGVCGAAAASAKAFTYELSICRFNS